MRNRMLSQLKVLLTKEWLIIRRSKLWTAVQILIPLMISLPLVFLLVQLSPAVRNDAIYYEPFKVTGDWRDLDRKLGKINTIYGYCRRKNERYLGLVFPENLSEEMASRIASEFEWRYWMNSSFQPHTFTLSVKIFDNETMLMDALMNDYQNSTICTKYFAGIVFNQYSVENRQLSYKFLLAEMLEIGSQWYTGEEIWIGNAPYAIPSDRNSLQTRPNVWSLGVLSLQYAVDNVFLNIVNATKYKEDNLDYTMIRMPEPAYFEKSLMKFLSFLIVFWQLFITPCVINIAANIASEKESGIKPYLSLMGLRTFVFYLSHAIVGFIKIAIVLLACAIALFAQFQTVSPSLFIVVTVLYCIAVVNFSLLISAMFHTSNSATKGVIFIWLTMIVLTYYPVPSSLNNIPACIFCSININFVFKCAVNIIQDYMNRDIYLGWSNVFENFSYQYSFGLALIMLLVDILWMALLTDYLDATYPSGDQPKRNPFFCCRSEKTIEIDTIDRRDVPRANIQSEEGADEVDVEVRDLYKVYGAQSVVDGLSFRAHRGEVTVLLGENGAGKSTTFSIITGLVGSSSGAVYIRGMMLHSDTLSLCQRQIGYCPQYSPLFKKLTVCEHLKLFAELKSGVDVKYDLQSLIKDLQLTGKENELAENLSGGMKRKLSVAISLIGGSSVVLMDEPTAGMDPGSRRAVADLLEKYKRDRTILLTTHYMDEADRLGDRIAIMVKGRLVCSGTSDYLKNSYGAGYLLAIDLKHNSPTSHRRASLLQEVKYFIKNAEIQSATAQQLTLLLPVEQKFKFAKLFDFLEENMEKYGINSFGLSLNTLEQVFLRVNESAEPCDDVDHEAIKQQISQLCEYSYTIDGINLLFTQLLVLMKKRFICYLRRWSRIISQILFPVIILALASYLMSEPINPKMNKKIVLRSDRISPSLVYVQADNAVDYLAQAFRKIIDEMPDINLIAISSRLNLTKLITELPKMPPPLSSAYGLHSSGDRISFKAYFNDKARYAPIITTTLLNNARLGNTSDSIEISLSPYGNASDSGDILTPDAQVVVVGPVLIVVFALITCGFVTYIVDENSSNFIHQQLLTGLHPIVFWTAVLIGDTILYSIACSGLMVTIILAKWLTRHIFDLILLWAMYLWPSLPFVYCAAFLFQQPGRAYILLIIITLVVSLSANFLVFIAVLVKPRISPYLHGVFLLTLPTYSMSNGLIMIIQSEWSKESIGLYSWEKLGRIYLIMGVSGLLFWTLLFVINSRRVTMLIHSLWQIKKTDNCPGDLQPVVVDSDVELERQRMLSNSSPKKAVEVLDLNKYYGKLHAVNNLTFSMESNECFGLLGVNGAGKTTTFSILAGLLLADSGEVYINGRSIAEKQVIGFCPQFDALHLDLSAWEMLNLMLALRGLTNRTKRINCALEAVALTQHAHKIARNLSGGQRRRLSIAISLATQAPFVMLDEPTAGVDPKARRHLWNLLNAMRDEQHAMLLTSHSMDECEALCSRLGIMWNGCLVAIGTPQHIKSKFGDGYTLSITLKDIDKREIMIDRVAQVFKNSSLKTLQPTSYMYWLIKRSKTDKWSVLYEKACKLAKEYPFISDFSLTQTSLEEAFLCISQHNGVEFAF